MSRRNTERGSNPRQAELCERKDLKSGKTATCYGVMTKKRDEAPMVVAKGAEEEIEPCCNRNSRSREDQ